MTMRRHGVTVTFRLRKQGVTKLSHTTPQTSLALIGRGSSVIVSRGHWELGKHGKRESFSVPVKFTGTLPPATFQLLCFLVQVFLNGGWPGTVVDVAMAIF